MQGSIAGNALAEVFRALIRERASGLLYCRAGEQEIGVYLEDGRLVNAESNAREHGLGLRLLDEGLLSPADLQAALARVGPGSSLAAVLVADAIVGDADVQRLQQALAQQIVHSLFEWTDGTYLFQEGDFSAKGQLELSTAGLVVEGVRRMFGLEDIRDRLLADERPLRTSVTTDASLGLEPTEGFVLSRVDGTLNTADICALSILSEEMTCRVLYGLYAAGLLDFGDEEAVERPQPVAATEPSARPAVERFVPDAPRPSPTRGSSGSYEPWQQERINEVGELFDGADQLDIHALAGLARDAAPTELERAYRELVARYHPAENDWLEDPELRSKFAFIIGKLGNAWKRLRSTTGGAQLASTEDLTGQAGVHVAFAKTERQRQIDETAKHAQRLHHEATKLLEVKSFHDAYTKIQQAIQLVPDDARYYALLASIEMRNPNSRWQKNAEQHWNKAIELDPWNASHHVGLAAQYKAAGLSSKAKRAYIRALEVDPNNRKALAEVPVNERPKKRLVPPEDEQPVDEVSS